jgi:hypothetical protein
MGEAQHFASIMPTARAAREVEDAIELKRLSQPAVLRV